MDIEHSLFRNTFETVLLIFIMKKNIKTNISLKLFNRESSWVQLWVSSICVHIFICICTHVHMCMCMCLCIWQYIFVFIFAYLYCIHIFLYVHLPTYIDTYISMCGFIYIYIYCKPLHVWIEVSVAVERMYVNNSNCDS